MSEPSQEEMIKALLLSDSESLPDYFASLPVSAKSVLIAGMLRKGHFEVTFTKVDGSIRIMPCTLAANSLPVLPEVVSENKRVKKHNPEILSVWCLDKQEWRSFKLDNVISVKRIA